MRFFKLAILAGVIISVVNCSPATKAEVSDNVEVADTVVILGDSNIWLAGDSCNHPKGWMTWFREQWSPALCRSYARSGASWSHTCATKTNPEEDIAILGDDNVIYNQVVRLRQAYQAGEQAVPTLLMVSAGGNDAWFSHKRPEEFALTVEEAFAVPDSVFLSKSPEQVLSLAGAIRYDCLQLRQLFPQAQIVLLTPPQMSKVEPQMLMRVSDIIEQTGQRMGLSTIRLDGDEPICRRVEMDTLTYTYDGIHTNEAGARHVAEYVIRQLSKIKGNAATKAAAADKPIK